MGVSKRHVSSADTLLKKSKRARRVSMSEREDSEELWDVLWRADQEKRAREALASESCSVSRHSPPGHHEERAEELAMQEHSVVMAGVTQQVQERHVLMGNVGVPDFSLFVGGFWGVPHRDESLAKQADIFGLSVGRVEQMASQLCLITLDCGFKSACAAHFGGGVFLTNAHVLSENSLSSAKMYVWNQRENVYVVKSLSEVTGAVQFPVPYNASRALLNPDLCLFQLQDLPDLGKALISQPVDLIAGEDLYAMHFERDERAGYGMRPLKLSRGKWWGLEYPFPHHTAIIAPGSSGSPFFVVRGGELVFAGMNFGGCSSFSMCLPIKLVSSIMQDVRSVVHDLSVLSFGDAPWRGSDSRKVEVKTKLYTLSVRFGCELKYFQQDDWKSVGIDEKVIRLHSSDFSLYLAAQFTRKDWLLRFGELEKAQQNKSKVEKKVFERQFKLAKLFGKQETLDAKVEVFNTKRSKLEEAFSFWKEESLDEWQQDTRCKTFGLSKTKTHVGAFRAVFRLEPLDGYAGSITVFGEFENSVDYHSEMYYVEVILSCLELAERSMRVVSDLSLTIVQLKDPCVHCAPLLARLIEVCSRHAADWDGLVPASFRFALYFDDVANNSSLRKCSSEVTVKELISVIVKAENVGPMWTMLKRCKAHVISEIWSENGELIIAVESTENVRAWFNNNKCTFL